LDIERIVAELKSERDRLNRAIAVLEGTSLRRAATRKNRAPNPGAHNKKRRSHLTPQGRKRLSELMKKRWVERKKKGW
jgi:hypothetical protein